MRNSELNFSLSLCTFATWHKNWVVIYGIENIPHQVNKEMNNKRMERLKTNHSHL